MIRYLALMSRMKKKVGMISVFGKRKKKANRLGMRPLAKGARVGILKIPRLPKLFSDLNMMCMEVPEI